MARDWASAQPDLFDRPASNTTLGQAERSKALEQLQALLIEALAKQTKQVEVGDEQDRV